MKRVLALHWLLLALAVPAGAAERAPPQSWGAIASTQGGWGTAFNHASRAAAEQAARTQCERAAGRPAGSCAVRIAFERSCAALATGNFGEWGAAAAASAALAREDAATQCNQHLPTEPCKVVASVCSLPPVRAR